MGSIQLHDPASLDGHLVNCCDSNLSRSDRLCLRRVYRTVERPDQLPSKWLQRMERQYSTHQVRSTKLHRSGCKGPYEQDQTPQTSQYGSPISVEGQLCENPTRQPRC